jgi:4'-phosphopantetheinyl transferase EntD
MDPASVLDAWRRILPSFVSVSAGPFLEDPAPLTARERRSAGEVDPARLRELENGRVHAKRALAMLGAAGAELAIGKDRAPRWPRGIVGSISHASRRKEGYVAAAVARTRWAQRLGIDVEYEGALDPGVWSHVLTAGEVARLLEQSPPTRLTEAQVIWCVKEAALKAARRRIEALEVDVRREAAGDEPVASWRICLAGKRGERQVWQGRSTRIEGLVLAAVAVRKRAC